MTVKCAVKGFISKNHMCPSLIVDDKSCGFKTYCEHQLKTDQTLCADDDDLKRSHSVIAAYKEKNR